MKSLARYMLCIGASALFAGCGGSQPPMSAYERNETTPTLSHDQNFRYTGGKQTFKVPAGVSNVTITAFGARGAPGGNFASGNVAIGGEGAIVTATISVTPGERLAIFVGGAGVKGGFNGGGNAGASYTSSYGGGASDVRQGGDGLADRIIVAGGGGGGGVDGYFCDGPSCNSSYSRPLGGQGGPGGGSKGGSGGMGGYSSSSNLFSGSGGIGGAQHRGGTGGAGGGGSNCGGADGTLGEGGLGGRNHCGPSGGGGGGGYYGGGGGGAGVLYGTSDNDSGAGGGGGGGSSFVESGARDVKIAPGASGKGNGRILIRW